MDGSLLPESFNARFREEARNGGREKGADERFAAFGVDTDGARKHQGHANVLLQGFVRVARIANLDNFERLAMEALGGQRGHDVMRMQHAETSRASIFFHCRDGFIERLESFDGLGDCGHLQI